MSLQPGKPPLPPDLKPNDSNPQSRNLKIWNCTNCRRRKVRCDRRHPCAPCTKNKVECIFPVSGRVPRRSRDTHLKKQTELVGRLRRLEAMVGDLSSQVELSTGIGQDNHDAVAEDPTSASRPLSTAKDLSGNLNISAEEPPNGYDLLNEDTEMTQFPENVGELDISSDGDIVVGSQFWTVFCKEVRANLSFIQFPETRPKTGAASITQSYLRLPIVTDIYSRSRISSKLYKDLPLSALMETPSPPPIRYRIVHATPAIIISCSETHPPLISRRICTLSHHRCHFCGRLMWTMLIHLSRSSMCQL